MKPRIRAEKDCLLCKGRAVCQLLTGGVSICKCITNKIDIRNSEGKKFKITLSKCGYKWKYEETNEVNKNENKTSEQNTNKF